MYAENIIVFPASRKQEPRPQTLRNVPVFRLSDPVKYRNSVSGAWHEGFILQIQIDPLSGKQWRVLIQTPFVNAWRDVAEVYHVSRR